MGLFDGIGATTEASTAAVAILLSAPVLLVVDAASMSASVAALVHGYDDGLRQLGHDGLGGVVLNRVGSDTHESILREALVPLGVPVLGALRRDGALTWRDRHLGLVPVVEHPEVVRRSLDRLAGVIARSVDLGAVERLARTATPQQVGQPVMGRPMTTEPVQVAVVSGPAFSFAYPDNLEQLAAAGAELLFFDPMEASALPDRAQGLYAGGGFPEVFVEALSDNEPLRHDVRRRVGEGLVTWAECGGLLWLASSLQGHPLCDVIPAASHDGRPDHGRVPHRPRPRRQPGRRPGRNAARPRAALLEASPRRRRAVPPGARRTVVGGVVDPDTARFVPPPPSRVRPRTCRALRPGGEPHRVRSGSRLSTRRAGAGATPGRTRRSARPAQDRRRRSCRRRQDHPVPLGQLRLGLPAELGRRSHRRCDRGSVGTRDRDRGGGDDVDRAAVEVDRLVAVGRRDDQLGVHRVCQQTLTEVRSLVAP